VSKTIKILALGDICGENAVTYVTHKLSAFKKFKGIDFVVANGENASLNGITQTICEQLYHSGVDVITGGNHIFDKKEVFDFMDECPYLIRPVNYPTTQKYGSAPGRGYNIFTFNGIRILVINAQGRVFMEPQLDDPFAVVEWVLDEKKGEYDIAILDFHAETTSEKFAMAHCFDGQIQAIFGTHTHVPTADEYIMPNGTGFITDIGMCGPLHSSLGIDADAMLRRMRTGLYVRHTVSHNQISAQGVVFTIEDGHCVEIFRVEI